MEILEVQTYFTSIVKSEKNVSAGVAAIRTLMEVIKKSQSETVQELEANLKDAINKMKNANYPVAAITSGCELFLRFITYTAGLDSSGSFNECKKIMLDRGELFLKKLDEARGKIVKFASKFILDGSKVLTHSRSRVVLQTLCQAFKQDKRFEVFVTVSAPDNSGIQMHKELQAMGIPCTLILDSAIGYVMEQIDFIMVGAEAVVESGGIVNKVGSYTMAVCAKEMKKPFYVLAESFKFSRLFPLNQQDLPAEYKYTSNVREKEDIKTAHPLVDYTPPSYITLLFTDIGILTPSAVSDELINLYL
ncbi:translation initiation factor eIF-2B subunit alpha [Anthonomus grandis grandis]|uniref:translation initiation factor eIF-2B subunit alpha n=1 Tax=Anthonomus grandis grandis TaxID=2921223 RepID=UPI0021657503|nr:translation initiation factor eIF-2B subunit alpha [Anthonomus grandis grandis]